MSIMVQRAHAVHSDITITPLLTSCHDTSFGCFGVLTESEMYGQDL